MLLQGREHFRPPDLGLTRYRYAIDIARDCIITHLPIDTTFVGMHGCQNVV